MESWLCYELEQYDFHTFIFCHSHWVCPSSWQCCTPGVGPRTWVAVESRHTVELLVLQKIAFTLHVYTSVELKNLENGVSHDGFGSKLMQKIQK